MANRIIKHYYECEAAPVYSQREVKEIDKSKTISDLSRQDLQSLIDRLRMEREAESLIRDLKRSSGEIDNYENPAKVDTQTPVNQLYHHGILGMKWGVRRYQNKDGSLTPKGKKRLQDEVDQAYTFAKSSMENLKSIQQNIKNPTHLKAYNELKKYFEELAKDKSKIPTDPELLEIIRMEVEDLTEEIKDNALSHHGILGMKWGIRRFQKEDGTRTPEGKKRDAEKDYEDSEDYKTSRTNKKKATSGLSNEELRKLNERLQLENTYKNLTAEKIEKSESFVQKALKDAAGQALTEFSKGVFLGTAKILIKNAAPTFAEFAFSIKDTKKKD